MLFLLISIMTDASNIAVIFFVKYNYATDPQWHNWNNRMYADWGPVGFRHRIATIVQFVAHTDETSAAQTGITRDNKSPIPRKIAGDSDCSVISGITDLTKAKSRMSPAVQGPGHTANIIHPRSQVNVMTIQPISVGTPNTKSVNSKTAAVYSLGPPPKHDVMSVCRQTYDSSPPTQSPVNVMPIQPFGTPNTQSVNSKTAAVSAFAPPPKGDIMAVMPSQTGIGQPPLVDTPVCQRKQPSEERSTITQSPVNDMHSQPGVGRQQTLPKTGCDSKQIGDPDCVTTGETIVENTFCTPQRGGDNASGKSGYDEKNNVSI